MTLAVRKKPRAGGYHVKTGCKTCKIRHVKCDEEKPTCLKCRSTGRVCDGYDVNRNNSKSQEDHGGQLVTTHAATRKAPSIIPGPNINITGTTQERRSFEFWRSLTGHDLAIALNIKQTHQLILQASHCDEAIRSAVVALGSMGERLSINNTLTLENEQANACHDFAHAQYCIALKRLRERISNDSEGTTNLAIILCFLFTVFEFLQGNDAGSLIHLRSGLNIIKRDYGSLAMGLHTVSSVVDPLRYELLTTFAIMDMQSTIWVGQRPLQPPLTVQLDGPGDTPKHIDRFNCVDDASESLNVQIIGTDHFRNMVAAYGGADAPNQVPPEVQAKRDSLLIRLRKWPVALEALMEKLRGNIDTTLSQRVAVLKMNFEIALLGLKTCLQPFDQQIYANHEPKFRLIVDLAKGVLGPMDEVVILGIPNIVAANHATNANPAAVFSFYAGIIRPLFYTATKCQNLRICREAIALLSASPWREGAWDSAAMARIAARRVQEAEEIYVHTDLPITDYVAHDQVEKDAEPGCHCCNG